MPVNPVLRRCCKLCVLIILSSVFMIECVSYWIQAQKWPAITCHSNRNCVKLLLVADPQIIGERFEFGFPIGTLARWDSDRYLSKTFHNVVNHVRPDSVIFLGDLMDEGSISSKEEFNRYHKRFTNIFPIDLLTNVIYLPGDNDIGGENEPITHDKIKKFQEKFGQRDVIHFKGITFIKVNRLRYTVPKLPSQAANETRIILSHLPLLLHPSPFIEEMLKSLKPHIILSAHEHKALHITSTSGSRQGKKEPILEMIQVDLSQSSLTHEILVPTCSYRMGVSAMGYGVLTIDPETDLTYMTILWLPGRFPHLFFYLILIVILCHVILCLYFRNLRRKRISFKAVSA